MDKALHYIWNFLLLWGAFGLLWDIYRKISTAVHTWRLKRFNNIQYATVSYVYTSSANKLSRRTVNLDYTADGDTYRKTVTSYFNFHQLPRRGDYMKIWVHPHNPSDFVLADKNPIPSDDVLAKRQA